MAIRVHAAWWYKEYLAKYTIDFSRPKKSAPIRRVGGALEPLSYICQTAYGVAFVQLDGKYRALIVLVHTQSMSLLLSLAV